MFESFGIAFISIVLEAMPFVLLGTLISSIIEVFVSTGWMTKQFEGGKLRFYFIAGLVGFIFPVCECAIVPIMRRLIKKGVPRGIAITFMLATPIVNPVVLLSTYYAFSGDIPMVLARAVFGYTGAVIIGMIMEWYMKGFKIEKEEAVESHSCSCHDHDHDHDHDHGDSCCGHDHEVEATWKDKAKDILSHTSSEFIDVGRFLIIGAILAASMQTFVPREAITIVSDNKELSILVMMLMAFVLSLCSEADAFIAATFRGTFSDSSLVAFLIFGPMIDIKNTIMLSATFKPKFVIRLIGVITLVCFILAMFSGLLV